MAEYIDRWAAEQVMCEKICHPGALCPDSHCIEIREMFAKIPAADVQPVKHGEWVDCKGSNGKDYRKCSVCFHTQDITGLMNYCPVCGADMRREECTKN